MELHLTGHQATGPLILTALNGVFLFYNNKLYTHGFAVIKIYLTVHTMDAERTGNVSVFSIRLM